MLTRLQKTHWWDDLEEHLRGALQHTVQALQANGGAFFVDPLPSGAQRLPITTGDLPHDELAQVETLAQGSREGESPVVVPAAEREGLQGVGSLLAIPLQAEGRSVGALALWAAEDGAFSRRRVHLAAVVAAQVALLVENHRLSSQVEYQAALAERARLAREIHDGLAQTLGYLRLRTAHLIEVLQREEAQDVAAEVREVQQLLDAAYVDAREAIDGLQLAAAESDLGSWMRELVQDFEILSGVPVTVCPAPEVPLPQDVQAQLQRVVQEALSNVRKHAAAHAVQIGWEVQDGNWLTLHIEDDGCGFDTQIAGHRSHHGLRIMRERTALLAGELQITSHQGQGTCVTVRLPLPEGERR
jgi:two-component system nitrate/nitrite sensor histidine kinase NarX